MRIIILIQALFLSYSLKAIGPAFNRMLMNEKAYCKDQLPDLSKVFLERIKKEFPKEMGLRFGYIKE
jgi:hypothetical protein